MHKRLHMWGNSLEDGVAANEIRSYRYGKPRLHHDNKISTMPTLGFSKFMFRCKPCWFSICAEQNQCHNVWYRYVVYNIIKCIILNRHWSWYQCLGIVVFMMTSSNGNIFRVTGPLCGEFTGHWGIPLTKASDAELWCFLSSVPKLTVQ